MNLLDGIDIRSQMIVAGYDTHVDSVKHFYVTTKDASGLTVYPVNDVDDVMARLHESTLHCGLLGVLVDDVRVIDGKLSCDRKHIVPLLILRTNGKLLGDEQLQRSIIGETLARLHQRTVKQRVLDCVKSNKALGDDSWVGDWIINTWCGKAHDWRVYVNDPASKASFCVRVDLRTGLCVGTTYDIKSEWVRVFDSWIADVNAKLMAATVW